MRCKNGNFSVWLIGKRKVRLVDAKFFKKLLQFCVPINQGKKSVDTAILFEVLIPISLKGNSFCFSFKDKRAGFSTVSANDSFWNLLFSFINKLKLIIFKNKFKDLQHQILFRDLQRYSTKLFFYIHQSKLINS